MSVYSDLRVGVYLLYVVLIIWRGLNHGIDGVAFALLVGFMGLRLLLYCAEWLHGRLLVRAEKEAFLRLDPEVQARVLKRSWLGVHRQLYRDAIDEGGVIEQEGAIERFPFSKRAQRETSALFWTLFSSTLILLVGVFFFWQGAGWVTWAIWAYSFAMAATLAVLRTRERFLQTEVEVSPFAVALLDPEGTRLSISWGSAFRVRLARFGRRLELIDATGTIRVPLDESRVGSARMFSLVRQYAGWDSPDAA